MMKQKPKPMPSIPQKLASQRIKILDAAPASGGKTNFVKYLLGDRLTRNASIMAKCCECMGYYYDGRVDCRNAACALYPYMPYRGKIGHVE